MFAIRDSEGRFVGRSSSKAGAHRLTRRSRHVGSSVNRADTRRDLTPGQVATLRTILREGGKVRITMGKAGRDVVRTSIVHELIRRRLVRGWDDRTRRMLSSGSSTGGGGVNVFDLYVTSLGVQMLGEADGHLNRADGGEPAPYQVILQQLGGQGRLRAMLGASFSQADDGRTLEMKFPNRLRSRPNFIRIRYEPGPDTYTVIFWRVDRSGPGKKLREVDDVYADSLREIIERETGLYLNLAGSANRADTVTSTYVPRGTVAGRRARIMGGFEGDLARAEIARLQGYKTGASGEPIDQEIARLRAAVRATT